MLFSLKMRKVLLLMINIILVERDYWLSLLRLKELLRRMFISRIIRYVSAITFFLRLKGRLADFFQPYYDYFTHTLHPAQPSPHNITLSTPLSTHPVLIQGGHILPIRQRVRRSSPLMWQDPYTLIIALNQKGEAAGQLYTDDGTGYGFTQGEYVWRQFEIKDRVLRSVVHEESKEVKGNVWERKIQHVEVEQVVILGMENRPESVRIGKGGADVQWSWEDGAGAGSKGGEERKASRLVLKKPGVGITGDWELEIR